MAKLYYQPPIDAIFEEVKKASMDLWRKKYPEASHPHYASEKISEIRPLTNVGDNVMSIIARFDSDNLGELARMLSKDARQALRERMKDGEYPEWLIPF